MNTEEFKMILEVVRDAGDGAKTIVIFYLLTPLVSVVLHFIGFTTMLILALKGGKKLVSICSTYSRAWQQVCDHVETKNTEHMLPNQRDINSVIKKIDSKRS